MNFKVFARASAVFILSLITFVSTSTAVADEDCWNFGIFEKTQMDKKEKASFAGDIKDISVVFNYDLGEVSGTISWNRIPSSSQTTNLVIGFFANSGDCVSVSEGFRMKGWGKKFARDWESTPSDYSPDMLGKLTSSPKSKKSFSFNWLRSDINADTRMGVHCVSVSTTVPSKYYKSSTTCIWTGNVSTCDGPGWYAGLKEQDLVVAWARSKWDDIHYTCTF
jgi:hypothetical protein